MNYYNLDKLIKIEQKGLRPSSWYVYEKGVTILGVVFRKQGIYYDLFRRTYIGTEAPVNHILQDGVVYEKREVVLHYQNGFGKSYYFDTEEAQKEFVSKFISLGKWQS